MAMEMHSPYCPPESGIFHVIGQDTYSVMLTKEKQLWNHVKMTDVFWVLFSKVLKQHKLK